MSPPAACFCALSRIDRKAFALLFGDKGTNKGSDKGSEKGSDKGFSVLFCLDKGRVAES